MSNPTGKGGFQERKNQINRKGRPRSFDAVRELAQEIARETVRDKNGDPALLPNGKQVTTVELILRSWSQSQDPRKQLAFVEYAYGKVPQQTEVTGKDGGPVVIKVIYDDAKAEPGD